MNYCFEKDVDREIQRRKRKRKRDKKIGEFIITIIFLLNASTLLIFLLAFLTGAAKFIL